MILYEHSTNIYTFIFCILVRQCGDIKRAFRGGSKFVFPRYQYWVSSCTFIIFPKFYRLHQLTSNIKMGAMGEELKKVMKHFNTTKSTDWQEICNLMFLRENTMPKWGRRRSRYTTNIQQFLKLINIRNLSIQWTIEYFWGVHTWFQ